VPLMPLKVAAGYIWRTAGSGRRGMEPHWVEIDTGRRLRKGMFVAQVVGKSMEPARVCKELWQPV